MQQRRLTCRLPKHGLYMSQSDSDVIIASFIVGVLNSVAFEKCLQVQFYTCAVCSVLITYMDYFHDGVNLLRSCKVAYLLMVINVAVSGANSMPACPPLSPASMQLLLASLTALHVCSMVFVVTGARNNAHSVLSDTAVSAAPLM